MSLIGNPEIKFALAQLKKDKPTYLEMSGALLTKAILNKESNDLAFLLEDMHQEALLWRQQLVAKVKPLSTQGQEIKSTAVPVEIKTVSNHLKVLQQNTRDAFSILETMWDTNCAWTFLNFLNFVQYEKDLALLPVGSIEVKEVLFRFVQNVLCRSSEFNDLLDENGNPFLPSLCYQLGFYLYGQQQYGYALAIFTFTSESHDLAKPIVMDCLAQVLNLYPSGIGYLSERSIAAVLELTIPADKEKSEPNELRKIIKPQIELLLHWLMPLAKYSNQTTYFLAEALHFIYKKCKNEEDLKMAAYLYKRAANQQHEPSILALADIYTRVDPEESKQLPEEDRIQHSNPNMFQELGYYKAQALRYGIVDEENELSDFKIEEQQRLEAEKMKLALENLEQQVADKASKRQKSYRLLRRLNSNLAKQPSEAKDFFRAEFLALHDLEGDEIEQTKMLAYRVLLDLKEKDFPTAASFMELLNSLIKHEVRFQQLQNDLMLTEETLAAQEVRKTIVSEILNSPYFSFLKKLVLAKNISAAAELAKLCDILQACKVENLPFNPLQEQIRNLIIIADAGHMAAVIHLIECYKKLPEAEKKLAFTQFIRGPHSIILRNHSKIDPAIAQLMAEVYHITLQYNDLLNELRYVEPLKALQQYATKLPKDKTLADEKELKETHLLLETPYQKALKNIFLRFHEQWLMLTSDDNDDDNSAHEAMDNLGELYLLLNKEDFDPNVVTIDRNRSFAQAFYYSYRAGDEGELISSQLRFIDFAEVTTEDVHEDPDDLTSQKLTRKYILGCFVDLFYHKLLHRLQQNHKIVAQGLAKFYRLVVQYQLKMEIGFPKDIDLEAEAKKCDAIALAPMSVYLPRENILEGVLQHFGQDETIKRLRLNAAVFIINTYDHCQPLQQKEFVEQFIQSQHFPLLLGFWQHYPELGIYVGKICYLALKYSIELKQLDARILYEVYLYTKSSNVVIDQRIYSFIKDHIKKNYNVLNSKDKQNNPHLLDALSSYSFLGVLYPGIAINKGPCLPFAYKYSMEAADSLMSSQVRLLDIAELQTPTECDRTLEKFHLSYLEGLKRLAPIERRAAKAVAQYYRLMQARQIFYLDQVVLPADLLAEADRFEALATRDPILERFSNPNRAFAMLIDLHALIAQLTLQNVSKDLAPLLSESHQLAAKVLTTAITISKQLMVAAGQPVMMKKTLALPVLEQKQSLSPEIYKQQINQQCKQAFPEAMQTDLLQTFDNLARIYRSIQEKLLKENHLDKMILIENWTVCFYSDIENNLPSNDQQKRQSIVNLSRRIILNHWQRLEIQARKADKDQLLAELSDHIHQQRQFDTETKISPQLALINQESSYSSLVLALKDHKMANEMMLKKQLRQNKIQIEKAIQIFIKILNEEKVTKDVASQAYQRLQELSNANHIAARFALAKFHFKRRQYKFGADALSLQTKPKDSYSQEVLEFLKDNYIDIFIFSSTNEYLARFLANLQQTNQLSFWHDFIKKEEEMIKDEMLVRRSGVWLVLATVEAIINPICHAIPKYFIRRMLYSPIFSVKNNFDQKLKLLYSLLYMPHLNKNFSPDELLNIFAENIEILDLNAKSHFVCYFLQRDKVYYQSLIILLGAETKITLDNVLDSIDKKPDFAQKKIITDHLGQLYLRIKNYPKAADCLFRFKSENSIWNEAELELLINENIIPHVKKDVAIIISSNFEKLLNPRLKCALTANVIVKLQESTIWNRLNAVCQARVLTYWLRVFPAVKLPKNVVSTTLAMLREDKITQKEQKSSDSILELIKHAVNVDEARLTLSLEVENDQVGIVGWFKKGDMHKEIYLLRELQVKLNQLSSKADSVTIYKLLNMTIKNLDKGWLRDNLVQYSSRLESDMQREVNHLRAIR